MNRSLSLLSLVMLAQLACGVGPPVVGGRAHAMNHQVDGLSACAGPTIVQGVDVSGYDDTVDWHAAANGGIVFGIARISDGIGYPDPYFQANWAGMLDAGVIRGAYQFFEAGDDMTAEANVVVQAVGRLGPNDLPVVIDIEGEPDGDVPTVEQMQTWMGVVEQGTGKLPMIYCGEGYWNEHFGNQFSANPLWVANWDVSCPAMPTGWTMWNIWQYSATGTAPGVTNSPGAADLDEFNGSAADLLTFAQQSAVSCGATTSSCSADTDCCLGLTCQGSTCQAAPMCTALDVACTDASQCCDGLACLVWTPSGSDPGTYCCYGVGANCASSRECCGGNLCADGTCVCVPENTYCQNDVDCCSGLSCQSGLCKTAPSSSTASSSSASSSSSGTVATSASGSTLTAGTSSSGGPTTTAASSSGALSTSTSTAGGTTSSSSASSAGTTSSSSGVSGGAGSGTTGSLSRSLSSSSTSGSSSASAKSGGCSSAPGRGGEWLALLGAVLALGGRPRRWSRG